MLQSINRSVRRKLMLVMLVTTFTALLVAAIALVTYELRTYERSWAADLITQADILARASAPALSFDDPRAAAENLALLKVRPQIRAAAIYAPNGKLFATYSAGTPPAQFPPLPGIEGYRIEGDEIVLFHRIVENNEILGTVYIRATYELMDRLTGYVTILGGVLLLSLLVAVIMSAWLQAAITKPILAVTQVAHQVMERRDFSLRVEKTTDDEIGYLVDAFNDMLAEVGTRAAALETSNRACSTRWPNAVAPRKRCAPPTGARTSSSRPSRTSCAIRWRRCAMRCASSTSRARMRPPRSARGT